VAPVLIVEAVVVTIEVAVPALVVMVAEAFPVTIEVVVVALVVMVAEAFPVTIEVVVAALVVMAAEVGAVLLLLDTRESEKTHMIYRNVEIYSWALRSQLVISKESDFICMKPAFT
jgi:hypothetical protein